MPVYDFRCTICDERFEVTRSMGSTAEETCPACSAPAKRVFTPVGVAFKGSGFHNTDYRSTGRSKPSAEKSDGAPACPAKIDGAAPCASCPSAAE
jgi:putative FmdB family regulatory protein